MELEDKLKESLAQRLRQGMPQDGEPDPQDKAAPQDNGEAVRLKDLAKKSEPKAEPKAEPKQQGDDLSIVNQKLKELTGGKIDDVKHLEELLQEAEKGTELYNQLQELQGKLQEYEEKLETAYPDEFTKKLAELRKAGASKEQIDAFWRINEIGDLNELSPEEVLKYKYMFKDGLSEEEARRKVQKDYPTDKDRLIELGYDPDVAEEMVKDAKVELKLAVRTAKKELEEYRTSLTDDPVRRKSSLEEKQEELLLKWGDALEDVITGLNSKVKVLEGNKASLAGDEYSEIAFEPPKEFLDAVPDLVAQYVVTNNIKPNRDGIANVREYLDKVMWAQYGKEFAKRAAMHAASVVERMKVAEFENNSIVNRRRRTVLPEGAEKAIEEYKKRRLGFA